MKPILSEDLITDTPDYSDLDPLQAPQWSLKLVYNNSPRTSLAYIIKKFEKMWNLSRPTQYYLSQLGISEDSHSAERALDRISTSVAQQSLQGVSDNLRDSFRRLIFLNSAEYKKF